MSIYSSSDSDDERMQLGRPFGRERPIHDILGGGKVADVLLWRNRNVSATILIAVSVIWYLFEVVEYNFVTLLCYMIITAMLVIFIWCKGADVFKWAPPRIHEMILDEHSFREVATMWHAKFSQFLSSFLNEVACGADFRLFILAIGSLWTISVIGNYISSINLLFFGCLCLETLPYLYERYEEQVDYHVGRVNRQMRRSYRRFDSEYLRKIPRGPVKEKKSK